MSGSFSQRPRFAGTASYYTNPTGFGQLANLLRSRFGESYGRTEGFVPFSSFFGKLGFGNQGFSKPNPEETISGFQTDIFRLPQILQFLRSIIERNPDILQQISSIIPQEEQEEFISGLSGLISVPEPTSPATPVQSTIPPTVLPPEQTITAESPAPGASTQPPAMTTPTISSPTSTPTSEVPSNFGFIGETPELTPEPVASSLTFNETPSSSPMENSVMQEIINDLFGLYE